MWHARDLVLNYFQIIQAQIPNHLQLQPSESKTLWEKHGIDASGIGDGHRKIVNFVGLDDASANFTMLGSETPMTLRKIIESDPASTIPINDVVNINRFDNRCEFFISTIPLENKTQFQ